MNLQRSGSGKFVMVRRCSFRSANFTRLALCAAWMLSIYGTYVYTRTDQLVRNNEQQSHYNRNIKMAMPPLDYAYQAKMHVYDKNMPLIFVGGMPRSGTTLMRTMLDAHPSIRCGQETRVIPRLLGMRASWFKSSKEKVRLEEAGVTADVINDAITQFILEVIVKHGKPAPFLCNKDPFTLKSTEYLRHLFPNSKYVLMIRDGRATTHSIISRKVTISGFDIKSYRDVITKWSRAIEMMVNQCDNVGPAVCHVVKYEQLVLHPMEQTRRIMKFLNITWDEAMMNHEQHISNISLSNVEKSTDQVQRALYLEALTSWFGHFPDDVLKDLPTIAPMLERLGYDPRNPKPSYGEPDQFVLNKIRTAQ